MAMNGSNMVCWDTAPCSLVGRHQTVEETVASSFLNIFSLKYFLTPYMTALSHIEGMKRGEVFCAHVMKGYRGSRGIAPVIRIIGTRSRGVVSFTPRPLYPGKGPRYPSYGRLVSTL
jgi:hypothetical protein